ncbi:MAG TPA: glycosyltransferase [Victivallales bacterium]|nr:glycosyltransferase [Victivallales bacterium]
MHIVQVITELKPAGAERILANLSICLKEKGHDITVISLKPLPENRIIVDELFSNNIPILSLNLTKLKPWRIFKLNKLINILINKSEIRNLKPEIIIHSHLMHANLICRLNKMLGGNFKLLNTIHIAEKRKSRFWYFIFDRLTLNYCDHINAVSEAARNHHSLKLNIDHRKISIVYNGINSPKTLNKEEITNLKKEWGFSNCSKVIGSVGRLNWQKGYDIFFKLLSGLSNNIPENDNWGVVILGEGNQRKLLEKLSVKASKNIKIALPGYRKNAPECISAFDLFVMPSRYEGQPLTLLEAMPTGISIVSSDIDTIKEVLHNYSNSISVDFQDKDSVIKSIMKIINNPNIKFDNHFTVEKMTKEYLEIYKKLQI